MACIYPVPCQVCDASSSNLNAKLYKLWLLAAMIAIHIARSQLIVGVLSMPNANKVTRDTIKIFASAMLYIVSVAIVLLSTLLLGLHRIVTTLY